MIDLSKKRSVREAFGKALVELGKENENVVVLDADLSASTQTKLFAKEFGNTVDDFTPLKAVQHAKYPILFIHGKEDRFIPVRMAHELYNACSSDKRLFLVDGAGHGASYANAPKEYKSAVMDFVNANK